jgi:hypothetical protein
LEDPLDISVVFFPLLLKYNAACNLSLPVGSSSVPASSC